MRRGRESGWAKPLANAASSATDNGPTTLAEMFWRTYAQAQGVAKPIKAPVKTKVAIHSDSSRIWGRSAPRHAIRLANSSSQRDANVKSQKLQVSTGARGMIVISFCSESLCTERLKARPLNGTAKRK